MTEPTAPLDFSHVTAPASLVSLAEAKDHLRLTDSVHDTDVTQKLGAAQETIIAVLSYGADPAWTSATVPKAVRSAILILTAALYELRGGEDSQDNMRKSWAAIDSLIAVYRDPTLR